jgi:uncharacterized repeat protein (TIGR01451 family)
MKKNSLITFGTLALFAAIGLVNNAPAIASWQQGTTQEIAQAASPNVKLMLTVEKKNIVKDAQGKQQVTWQDLGSKAQVTSQDILRYTVNGNNQGNKAAKNLVVTQPISPQMTYIMNSAAGTNSAEITYSIDGGKTFVANPTIKVKLNNGQIDERPAPATAYTNVRWKFTQSIDPAGKVQASYQVKVR